MGITYVDSTYTDTSAVVKYKRRLCAWPNPHRYPDMPDEEICIGCSHGHIYMIEDYEGYAALYLAEKAELDAAIKAEKDAFSITPIRNKGIGKWFYNNKKKQKNTDHWIFYDFETTCG